MEAHSEDDLWFVQLSDGGVRAYSLDELDTAFQTGAIDEATLVRQDGTLEWTPLGVVLSGGDAPESAAQPAVFAAPPSESPISAAPVSAAPPSAVPPPVVAELSLDDGDAPSFGRSKARVAIAAVATLAVLAAAGVTALRVAGSADPAKVTASVPVSITQASTPTTTTGGESIFGDAGPRLNDEQRRMLMDLDKKHDAEMQQRRASRPASAAPSRPLKLGDGIQKGGNKYDPLNGAL